MSTLAQTNANVFTDKDIYSNLVPPHGSSTLKPLALVGDALQTAIKKAQTLPKLTLSSRERGDLIMLGIGGFTPLDGFMGEADYLGVVERMTLDAGGVDGDYQGVFFPIPITLSTDAATAKTLNIGDDVALYASDDDGGELMGVLSIASIYTPDKVKECTSTFGTTDPNHVGVAQVLASGDVYLGGKVQVFSQGEFVAQYPEIYKTPAQTRALFQAKNWRTVAAFQTRNPMHRSHEYLAKIAIEICDGVMVHSLLGKLKKGDIPADVRQEAIATLIDKYFKKDTVIQAGYPLDMRYAGPKEALLHALFRQNYGCSHLIVGRDHAGVGDYYGAFDAQKIFDTLDKDALITKPLKIDWTFYCHECAGMASAKTCPHDAKSHVKISGTALRNALANGDDVPNTFSRPEVLQILRKYYASES
ncbi:sulfate adenylyltransferase [Moraxella caviae]|uniref:Sulfate adenylyltransferase n=1 Tax=Moraxella caviae TaxID=34060 RepID=A0A1S9ZV68_9GAMM|nr:sulfate adenylyltransferase [Moraxella caviae]OOR87310.1 sulfate adenylyltransferase [Moraxella caviae]STZ14627.1 Probable bifunctional SAT/APS kinase [Moraxella caviae]VEW11396.1 Probable bifunctional SAT/APS kinase [Moraxella caviae]